MKSLLFPTTHFRLAIVAAGLALSLNAGAAMAEVVAVVSANNPVTTLSKYQIAAIFLGETNHFPDDGKVVAIDQGGRSPVRDEFYARFADKTAAQVKAHWSRIIFTGRGRPPDNVSNDSAVKKFLSENPNAIGYMDRKQVDETVKVLIVQ